ncbi:PAAR domain-containing protein [Burkholderia vietnamiensis]|uniref:PAAR domain-containing protein n=1 Tax=Burkholderia vietnamiensis TaxID=60552 RepID=UPI003F5115A7
MSDSLQNRRATDTEWASPSLGCHATYEAGREIDADTNHGHNGKVKTSSATMRFDGRFVACKGDCVSCPRHSSVSPNAIEEGDLSMTEDGVPNARYGHRATCGWTSASSQL